MKEIKEHPRNNNISFIEEEHRYFYNCDDRKIEFDGVTSWINNYTKPFDKSIAKYIAYKDGITEKEVLDNWESARQYGNYVDYVIGSYINGVNIEAPEVELFKKAMEEKKLTPVISEWTIYDEDIKRASSIDVLAKNENGEYVIIDLKSMEKEIKFNSYKDRKMSYPLNNLPDSKYFKQALQIGIYKYWLDNKYTIPVSNEKYVLRIRPDFYQWIPIIPVDLEIEKLYKFENEN